MSAEPYLLLVEDNPGDARLAETLLEDLQGALPPLHWVQTLAAGIQVLLDRPGCTAVLLDLGLPDSDGLEALKLLVGAHRDVPVVVLTGHDHEAAALEAIGAGAQDYLVKGSFDAEALRRCVQFATVRQRAERMVVQRALRDDLTGLARRTLLLDRLQVAIQRGRRQGGPTAALLFIDLDGFKAINDHHGHAAGDEVLRAVAQRLSAGVRHTDTACRLGGDEFVVLLNGLEEAGSAAATIAAKLLAAIEEPIDHAASGPLRVSASIGVVVFDGPALDAEALLARADAAMYEAKTAGKGRVQLQLDLAGGG